MEQKPIPAPAPGGQTTPATLRPRQIYELDGRDRLLLPLAWGLGVLCVDLLLAEGGGIPGLGVTVLTAAWYAVLFWYGGLKGFARRENRLLFAAVCLLALTFTLYSNRWFRAWNLPALAALLGIQAFGWSGAAVRPWSAPGMLWERLVLLLDALFNRLGASFQALGSLRGARKKSARAPYVLGGLLVCVPLLLVVLPLLLSADALFNRVAADLIRRLFRLLSPLWVARLVVGLMLAPFLFGLLYALRHPRPLKEAPAVRAPALEAAGPVTVLAVMDGLYLFFIAVQFAGLFGGERYLASAGISHAEYARSGFFQLVFVAGLNLILVLAALQLCRGEGRGRRWVQGLSTAMVGMSAVMLASAAWRMTLYTLEYGLTFKRVLTYWGMVMVGIFLATALLKIWRRGFRFFKVLFTVSIAGWLALNLLNVDAVVARYNVERLPPKAAAESVLRADGRAAYAAVPALTELAGRCREPWLTVLLEDTRAQAAREAGVWENWSVSVQRAALGGE